MNEIQRWDMWELSLQSKTTYDNPFKDASVRATFTHEKTGRAIETDGFYDGDNTYRIRFMPQEEGRWSYQTMSEDRALNGASGTLTCVAPTHHHLHGPIPGQMKKARCSHP